MYKIEKSRPIGLMLAVFMGVSMLFTGCGKQTATSAAATSGNATQGTAAAKDTAQNLKPVNLTWYVEAAPQPDMSSVMEEVNKILKDKLNVKLTLNTINWGDEYNQKMKLKFAAQESFDLCFTASWAADIFSNVNKGNFLALDELLDKYGPTVKKNTPEDIWNATKIKGKIYAVLNGYNATSEGFAVQKPLAEKYKLDTASLKSVADLEPFLAQIKKNEPDKIPYLMDYLGINSWFSDGTEGVQGGNGMPGSIKRGDKSLKVFNQYATPEFENWCKLARDWYLKGYFKRECATIKDTEADKKAGKFAAMPAQPAPGAEELLKQQTGIDYIIVPTCEPFLGANLFTTATAINVRSENPERSMMLLEEIAKNKDLLNLLSIGIKDKHYKVISQDSASGKIEVETIKTGGYDAGIFWEFADGNSAWFVNKGASFGLNAKKLEFNRKAQPSVLSGFVMDTTPIKTEMAQVGPVMDEYLSLLRTGTVAPEGKLQEFLAKMKQAGSDKIIDETQKQVDAWKVNK